MPLPGKYQNLMVASERTTVPPTILLGESFFSMSIENYHVVNEAIERVLHKIQATSGAFLQDHVAELRKLATQLKPSTAFDDAVAQAVGKLLLNASSGLAVRSAAVSEDNGNHSYAGLYKTLLGVPSNVESVGKAVLEVWTSYFEYAAVAERFIGRESGRWAEDECDGATAHSRDHRWRCFLRVTPAWRWSSA